MEQEVIETIARCLNNNEPAALVTVLANSGSSPAKSGAIMAVSGNRSTAGTVGGGTLEFQAIDEAMQCIADNTNKEISYALNGQGKLNMSCGGAVKLFIKVFAPQSVLLLVGAGHVNLELYRLAVLLGFRIIVVDDRTELLSPERFPKAECVHAPDIAETLKTVSITPQTFIAIATRSHDSDRLSLAAVAGSQAAYIGMIGSRGKIKIALRYLLDQGITQDRIEQIYAPMGLNIASIQPKEIAVSIMSEMLLVKNNGSPEHMRIIKQTHQKPV